MSINRKPTKTLKIGDLTPSSSCSGAVTSVYFNPESFALYEHTCIGSGTPMRAFHSIDLYIGKVPNDCQDAEALESYAKSFEDVLLLLSLNHYVFWDGNNFRGKVTESYQETLEELREAWQCGLDDLPRVYSADEWFSEAMTSYEIANGVLEKGLEAWIQDEIDAAEQDGFILKKEDVKQYVLHCLKEDLETTQNAIWDEEGMGDTLDELLDRKESLQDLTGEREFS